MILKYIPLFPEASEFITITGAFPFVDPAVKYIMSL